MDALTALDRTDQLVTGLIADFTSDDRTRSTPCTEWNVHEVLHHMCSGGHMIAGGLQGQAPPDDAPDPLADGPANGWRTTVDHLRAAATPDALAATHQMPFGEVPGEMALSVIVADHATHAWDLAKAVGAELAMDDELAAWSLRVWQNLAPAEGRAEGGPFAPVVEVANSASAVDRLAAYTGRQP
jgi:uncharacterized protein (TIGR03086 family)